MNANLPLPQPKTGRPPCPLDDVVLAGNQAAGIVAGGYMTQPNVAGQRPEQRYSFSNEYRHASNDETLNEPCAQESLNGNAAVNVQVRSAARGQPGNDLGRLTGHLFHSAAFYHRQIERAVAQHHNALAAIWPRRPKSQDRFESVAADNNGI